MQVSRAGTEDSSSLHTEAAGGCFGIAPDVLCPLPASPGPPSPGLLLSHCLPVLTCNSIRRHECNNSPLAYLLMTAWVGYKVRKLSFGFLQCGIALSHNPHNPNCATPCLLSPLPHPMWPLPWKLRALPLFHLMPPLSYHLDPMTPWQYNV